METTREKYFINNTMICLLKAIEGRDTCVELQGDVECKGTIVSVDGYMNITMENVKYNSPTRSRTFDQFFITGRKIRYVHIPDDVDMKQAMERKLKQFCMHSSNLRVRQELKDQAWAKLKKKENIAKAALNKVRVLDEGS